MSPAARLAKHAEARKLALAEADSLEEHANNYWDNPDCADAIAERAKAAQIRRDCAAPDEEPGDIQLFVFFGGIALLAALYAVAIYLAIHRS